MVTKETAITPAPTPTPIPMTVVRDNPELVGCELAVAPGLSVPEVGVGISFED